MLDHDELTNEQRFWMKVVSLSFDLEHHLQCKDMYFKSSFIDNIALRIISDILKQDVSWLEKRLIDVRVTIWKIKGNVSWYRTRMYWKLTLLKEVL